MGHEKCSFTYLTSLSTNQRSAKIYCVVSTYQQHLGQEERHRQEAHPHHPCSHDSQHVDVVASDFNGITWRSRIRNNISTIDEAFTHCALPTPPGPTPTVEPGSIPNNWADVCEFLNTTGFRTISETLRPTEERCLHETWLHLDFVVWRNTWSQQSEHDRHISLIGGPTPYQDGQQKKRISDVMSDHWLSS